MKVKVKGKDILVARIVDVPERKVIRVFVPPVGMLSFENDEYKGGLLERSKAEFTKSVQSKIDALLKTK